MSEAKRAAAESDVKEMGTEPVGGRVLCDKCGEPGESFCARCKADLESWFDEREGK